MIRTLTILVGALIACSACRTMEGRFKGDSSNRDANQDSDVKARRLSEESEGLPGYQLACAFVQKAQAGSPRSDVGCRYQDRETKQKAALNQIAKDWRWNFELPLDSKGVTAAVEEKPDDSPWHALYTFEGGDPVIMQEIAASTEIVSEITPVASREPIVIANKVSVLEDPTLSDQQTTGVEQPGG